MTWNSKEWKNINKQYRDLFRKTQYKNLSISDYDHKHEVCWGEKIQTLTHSHTNNHGTLNNSLGTITPNLTINAYDDWKQPGMKLSATAKGQIPTRLQKLMKMNNSMDKMKLNKSPEAQLANPTHQRHVSLTSNLLKKHFKRDSSVKRPVMNLLSKKDKKIPKRDYSNIREKRDALNYTAAAIHPQYQKVNEKYKHFLAKRRSMLNHSQLAHQPKELE